LLLSQFTQTRSYGLPVGGPASRTLAELALNPVDLYLDRKGITFCRYVDDFHIFAETKEQAFNHLAFLAHLDLAETINVEELPPEARLMRLSVYYDPYSPTAEEDYAALQEAVSSIDLVGILSREIAKTNIDIQVTKQAIGAIRALTPELRPGAIATLLEPGNLETLAPVFGNVMRLLRSLYSEMDEMTKDLADRTMLSLFAHRSHLVQNDLNLAYLLQVFGQRQSAEKERILIESFDQNTSPLVRTEIILIMAKWRVTFWLSDLLRRFGSLSNWERKAFIVASFHMSDEGEHWLNHTKRTLSPAEIVIRDWYKERLQRTTEVPI
jgi:hypothetical protein